MDEEKYRIAVATSDGENIDLHFGRADSFDIYDADREGRVTFRERRENTPPCENGIHRDDRLLEAAETIRDCDFVLAARAGPGAQAALAQLGVDVDEIPGNVMDAIDRVLLFLEAQRIINGG